MKYNTLIYIFSISMVLLPVFGQSARSASDIIMKSGSIRNPAVRSKIVKELSEKSTRRRELADEKAKQKGFPIRVEHSGGHTHELRDFRNGKPLYRTTHNANAAISTGANILRMPPYSADGGSMTVGVWDAGSVLTNHQEFIGRVISVDGAAANDHSTHVGGTLAAAGLITSARGMAPAAKIHSYDWNNDLSEMTGRGASYPGEPGKLYISNHSYGIYAGWVGPHSTSPKWEWYGDGSDASGIEPYFGMYVSDTASIDSMAYSLPYYLSFWSAGNDRNDNPVNGDIVTLSPGSVITYNYDAALHPPGDGVYFGGYDGITFEGVAKNVITVGSVSDAVSGGVRAPSAAVVSSFSCFGPTDDGRIKPDLVANGEALYSTLKTTPSSYGSYWGTSMSSPNAAGTALQLHEWFNILFPGYTMRASTIKALLIHTATDRGAVGPDYKYGWGLVDGAAAAELLQNYHVNPGTQSVIEDRLTDTRTERVFSFEWDGTNEICATLCWTDPPGLSTTLVNSRLSRLVNNLDLRIVAPDNTVYEPWVMPFVDTWTAASCDLPATTGSNKTDNVEQVLISAPPAAGFYEARVSYAGSLTDSAQSFSLILSGISSHNPAPCPELTESTPVTGSGELLFTLKGDNFMPGAAVTLKHASSSVSGTNIELLGNQVKARFRTTGMASGWWNMDVINPDGQRAVLYNAFVVPGPLLFEDFETNNIVDKGWSISADEGVNQWAITTSQSVSPTRSMHSPGAETRSDTSLVSPSYTISPTTVDLKISFYHDFSFEANDGGVLEFSLDGGGWFDVAGDGSGAIFSLNGYNAVIGTGGGKWTNRNPLGGESGWSGSSGGFIQSVVKITDIAMYAGRTLRVRWRLTTNTGDLSDGWYVDDFVITGSPPQPHVKGSLILLK